MRYIFVELNLILMQSAATISSDIKHILHYTVICSYTYFIYGYILLYTRLFELYSLTT